MNTTEKCGLDVSGIEQRSGSLPFDESKELPTFIQYGTSSEKPVTIGMTKKTLQ